MEFKNKLSRLFVMLAVLIGTIVAASIVFVGVVEGPNQIQILKFGPAYISRNYQMLYQLWGSMWGYIVWMIKAKKIVPLNIFVEVFVIPFSVFSISGLVFSLKYKDLKAWTPFKKKEKIYGDARWATEEDVKKANLREKKGMVLGVDEEGYFVAGGCQHALLFAPTGSGKGVGFVIPNLLFWEESCVVHDVKIENYNLTSGWRTKIGHSCYLWAPADPDGHTHCYNPMDWISSKPGQMVDDVQKMANLILPKQDFWENEARTLFVGIVLYLLAVPERMKSFGEVVRVIRSDDVAYNLAVALDTVGKQMHPVAYMNLAAFLQKADKERSGVVSTLSSGLELWANPLIDTATATSDFNVQDLKKKKMSVFVGVTPDNIKRLEKLMQIFYQQSIDFMTRKIPDPKEEPYKVLFLMDEFPTVGKMPSFLSGIAFFRGYNVRLFLIIQDTQQLKGTYEESGMNSFLSNSTYRITYAANNVETANLISQLCGNKTVESISETKPKFLDFSPGGKSQNVSSASRALILPQEVITMPRDEQIVMIESTPPIKSKKIFYYKDKMFTSRLLPPPPIPHQEPYDPSKLAIPSDEDAQPGDGSESEKENA